MRDVVVVGGSFAGLSASLYLGRARRTVTVIDAGVPRNRTSPAAHGLIGRDGLAPGAILAEARAQVAAYPTIAFVSDTAVDAESTGDGFAVTLGSGARLEARRVVLAFGLRDEVPAIPGLAERWGRSVLHCPYCHGYEFSGRRLGVLQTSPQSVHQALLVAEWGPTTYCTNGEALPSTADRALLDAKGIAVETAVVQALDGEGDRLRVLALEDGRELPIEALYVGPRTHLNSDLPHRLGCVVDEGPWGPIVRTDDWRATTTPGVFAAGDITRAAHNVTWASADGVTAGVATHRSLVFPAA